MPSLWDRLSGDLQKALLAIVIISGGAAGCGPQPQIFDPAPPPQMSPTPRNKVFQTPIICDPAPPPAVRTATSSRQGTPTPTPMIFDPAPEPSSRYQSRDTLPLAELRTITIVWKGGRDFAIETAWPECNVSWSVSGGQILGEGERIIWQPPAEAGSYLLQAFAEWGQAGVAIDAMEVTVDQNGVVTVE